MKIWLKNDEGLHHEDIPARPLFSCQLFYYPFESRTLTDCNLRCVHKRLGDLTFIPAKPSDPINPDENIKARRQQTFGLIPTTFGIFKWARRRSEVMGGAKAGRWRALWEPDVLRLWDVLEDSSSALKLKENAEKVRVWTQKMKTFLELKLHDFKHIWC